MAGFATLALLQAAKQQTVSYVGVKTDVELADDWGLVGTQTVPAGTPGVAYSSDATSLVRFQDLSSNRKFLVGASVFQASTAFYDVRLIDKLVGVGGILLNSTGNRTVNSTALTRYTDGADVMVYLIVDVIGATTAPVISLSSYTNQAGTNARAGGTFTFTSLTTDVGTVYGPMPLQTGDTGVRSVETLNVATAAGGSCSVTVLLARTIVELDAHEHWQGVTEKNMPLPFMQMQRIYDGASIAGLAKGLSGNETFFGTFTIAID